MREADLFCFPTRYIGENQPVNLIEAMAFGLPIVTTRWRSLPEMLPLNYPGLVDSQSPEQIAAALIRLRTGGRAKPRAKISWAGLPSNVIWKTWPRPFTAWRPPRRPGHWGCKIPGPQPRTKSEFRRVSKPGSAPAIERMVRGFNAFPVFGFCGLWLLCGHFNAGFRDKALRNRWRQLFWFH